MTNELNHTNNRITGLNKAFIIGIILNSLYVLVQVFIGLKINSLSLLSDAGHNFIDVASLALAMLAYKLSSSKSSDKYTFGFKKASILISLLNSIILLLSIGAIGYEAMYRFQNPEQLSGKTIAIIAAIGIFINGISAFMFFREKGRDINVKSAFIHLILDVLVSLGLVVGGIIIHYTHLYWIDPMLSILICSIIIASTWNLLKENLKLSLDGVPHNVDIQNIKQIILKTNGVENFHHLHIWAISTTPNAMTVHLVVSETLSSLELLKIKENLRHKLEHLNIHHSTLETEFYTDNCNQAEC
jgi:cobalt-zinc-cadmium efflux system protein